MCKGYEIFYEFLSLSKHKRLRVKCFLQKDQSIESLTSLFKSANWSEREMYDMLGVKIIKHPKNQSYVEWDPRRMMHGNFEWIINRILDIVGTSRSHHQKLEIADFRWFNREILTTPRSRLMFHSKFQTLRHALMRRG